MRTPNKRGGARAVLASAGLLAGLDMAPPVSAQTVAERVCTASGTVDKEKLASLLFERYPVSQAGQGDLGGSSYREKIHRIKQQDQPCPACSESDREQFEQMRIRLNAIVAQSGVPVEQRDGLFGGASVTELPCNQPVLEKALGAPPRVADAPAPRWRLRGTATDLAIAQSDQDFPDSVPASLSIQRDRLNDTETSTAEAFAGYLLPVHLAGQATVIPYVGLVKSRVDAAGVFDAAQSTDRRIAGLSADIFWRTPSGIGGMASGYRLIAGLEGSSDRVDHTRRRTASVSFKPYIWYVNRAVFLNDWLYIRPLLTLRLDAIHYGRRSLFAEVAQKQEHARRAGAEAGFSLAKADERIRYSYRYLKLNDWKGQGDVSHASQSLEMRLDQQGYAAVVLRYERGTPDQTFEREKLLSLLFTLRY